MEVFCDFVRALGSLRSNGFGRAWGAWMSSWYRISRRGLWHRRRRQFARSSVEQFESRTLLTSIGFTAEAGLLSIRGDGPTGETIVLETTETGAVRVSTQIAVDGFGEPILAASVRSIVVSGTRSGDVIDLSAATDQVFSGLGGRGVFINGRGGRDTIIGSDGPDRLLGGGGVDSIRGGGGNDVIKGQGGTGDVLAGGPGDDTIDGGTGIDVLTEIGDVDFVLTDNRLSGRGRDRLRNIERAILIGGPGDNWLDARGFSGSVRLSGQAGDDHLWGGTGVGHLNGGRGDDTIIGGGAGGRLIGGSGADSLRGGGGGETLKGQGGNDWIVIESEGGSVRDIEAGDTVFLERRSTVETDSTVSLDRLRLPHGHDLEVVTRISDVSRWGARTRTALLVTDPQRGGLYEDAADGLFVEWFGAVGDGVTDDTRAIQQAIKVAGEGATIRFEAEKTYLVSSAIRPLSRQTLIGYGATIKRIDEVRTELTEAFDELDDQMASLDCLPCATRWISVADASAFRVGMQVSLFTDTTSDPRNHTIKFIDGNRLMLAINLTHVFPVGTTVVSSFHILLPFLGTHDVRMLGLTIDGNARGNPSFARWELHNSVRSYSTRGIIRDMRIVDSQSEGVVIGGDDSLVENTVVLRAGGNGVHLSGGRRIRILNNTIRDTNLAGHRVGHVGGNITFSRRAPDSVISGNSLINGRAGIGGFNNSGGTGATISDNTIRNSRLFVLDGRANNGGANGGLTFNNNECFDSNTFLLDNADGFRQDSGPCDIEIRDNRFVGCRLVISRARDVVVEGNQWSGLDEHDHPVIKIIDSQRVRVADHIDGGIYGVQLTGSQTRDITVSGTVTNARQAPVRVDGVLDMEPSIRIEVEILR